MFTIDNTEGFSESDLPLLNEALAALVADGVDEKNASDIVTNNWTDGENTVESLIRR